MQYAIIDDHRKQAFSGGRGICPICNSPMIAKCGTRILHHWAHASRANCDLWWENETQWHRDWKNLFPEKCREVSYTAPDGEIHRADIVTPTGIVIEVQHSSMTDVERISREEFYGNMVWVIDGSPFMQNFDIFHLLPAPSSEVAQDLVWFKATRRMQGAAQGAFFRLSECRDEYPNATKSDYRKDSLGGMVEIHGLHKIEEQVKQAYRGHRQYDWVKPRRTWLDASCPVYIDLGDAILARLETYDDTGLKCLCLISKQDFIQDVMTKSDAAAIANRI